MVSGTRVPRWHEAVPLLALVMRGGALVVRVTSGQAPTTNLPQWAVVFVVVGGLFVAMKAIGEWRGGLGTLTFLSGEVADAFLWDRTTFSAIPAFAFAPFICGTLCSMNAGDKARGRGWGTVRKEMVLNSSPCPSVHQVTFDQEQLPVCFTLLVVQLYPLTLDILLFGDLRAHSVDVSDNPRIDDGDKSVVDKTAVD
jgi:hypothetical protein